MRVKDRPEIKLDWMDGAVMLVIVLGPLLIWGRQAWLWMVGIVLVIWVLKNFKTVATILLILMCIKS
jgi:hypothetical protein